ncbi:hypothetical protein FH972_024119 [Carpinus fangiana]|uniref:Uncharacterized protein n=1 Tax=Carpinus fangiana TaxID=176857 RepID=A0A5N6KXE6_9ROSI|nr:hypothetical protein FH972_024119 [Carpinus fangiana]
MASYQRLSNRNLGGVIRASGTLKPRIAHDIRARPPQSTGLRGGRHSMFLHVAPPSTKREIIRPQGRDVAWDFGPCYGIIVSHSRHRG